MAADLISRDQLKDYLRIGDKENEDADNALDFIVNAVSERIETYCDRTFIRSAAITEVRAGNGAHEILMLHGPPQTLTTVKYWDGDSWEPVSGTFTTGIADGDAKSHLVYFTDGSRFIIRTRYQFIYASLWTTRSKLPDDLQLAALEMAALAWKRQENRAHGVTQISIGDETVTMDFKMTQNVKDLLVPYERAIV